MNLVRSRHGRGATPRAVSDGRVRRGLGVVAHFPTFMDPEALQRRNDPREVFNALLSTWLDLAAANPLDICVHPAVASVAPSSAPALRGIRPAMWPSRTDSALPWRWSCLRIRIATVPRCARGGMMHARQSVRLPRWGRRGCSRSRMDCARGGTRIPPRQEEGRRSPRSAARHRTSAVV